MVVVFVLFSSQSLKWDVEVPEPAEKPRQRPSGPDQETQGIA